MSETNGIVRDGVLKSLHCVENNDWESWSVGSEECSIMNPSLLNRLYSLSWLCMNCVLIIWIMSEWEWRWIVTHGVAHQPLDRSVRSIDREWLDLIIRIMDWLGYGSEQRYQIVDCDEWFDKICKLSVQWFMIINVNSMKQREWGLETLASVSDGWFEGRSIEWWWDERKRTWGLEGIGVEETSILELDSTGW